VNGPINTKRALVLFSGGQDSTAFLAWALNNFDEVIAFTFDYDQRHKIELIQALKICKMLDVEQEAMKIDIFSQLSENSLTHDLEITPGTNSKLPSTFVPGRNLVFLSLAAAKAYQLGIKDIVIGVCQTDYSGYPDCRENFIKSMEKTISLSMDTEFRIHTPLMFLSKGETVLMMNDLGKLDWLKETHTCYEGKRPACGKCPACLLRLKGFEEAGIQDPLAYS